MKQIILLLTFTILCKFSIAQEIVKIKGEFQLTWQQEKESKKEAKERAEKFARINALEQSFGTVVVQGNSTYIKNKQTGEKVETKTTFNMIGNTFVKGEIIEVKKLKFEEIKWKEKIGREKVEQIDIKCKIVATAREIDETRVDFEVYSLSGNMLNNKTTTFYDGDNFFLYFKSPVSGYLSVYIDDNKNAVKILPYQEMASEFDNGVPVKADKEYIFFDNNKKYFENKFALVDELELASESDQDLNRVFVIFSQEPLNKPRLKKNITADILTEEEKKKNYTVPKSLPSEDFMKWLIKNQYIRTDLQRQIINITIEKK